MVNAYIRELVQELNQQIEAFEAPSTNTTWEKKLPTYINNLEFCERLKLLSPEQRNNVLELIQSEKKYTPQIFNDLIEYFLSKQRTFISKTKKHLKLSDVLEELKKYSFNQTTLFLESIKNESSWLIGDGSLEEFNQILAVSPDLPSIRAQLASSIANLPNLPKLDALHQLSILELENLSELQALLESSIAQLPNSSNLSDELNRLLELSKYSDSAKKLQSYTYAAIKKRRLSNILQNFSSEDRASFLETIKEDIHWLIGDSPREFTQVLESLSPKQATFVFETMKDEIEEMLNSPENITTLLNNMPLEYLAMFGNKYQEKTLPLIRSELTEIFTNFEELEKHNISPEELIKHIFIHIIAMPYTESTKLLNVHQSTILPFIEKYFTTPLQLEKLKFIFRIIPPNHLDNFINKHQNEILNLLKEPDVFGMLLGSLDTEAIEVFKDFFPEIIQTIDDFLDMIEDCPLSTIPVIYHILKTHPPTEYNLDEAIEALARKKPTFFERTIPFLKQKYKWAKNNPLFNEPVAQSLFIQQNPFPEIPEHATKTPPKTAPLEQKLDAAWDKRVLEQLKNIRKKYPGETEKEKKALAAACKALLANNWALIQNSSLGYTAKPNSNITKLMIELAVFVAKEQDLDPLNVLMPEVSFENIYAGKSEVEIKNFSTQAIQEVLDTHILSQNGQYVCPVSLLTQIPAEEDSEAYLKRNHSISPEEFRRLSEHSELTQDVIHKKQTYDALVRDQSNLFTQLNLLVRQLNLDHTQRAVGNAINNFKTYYEKLPKEEKNKIPAELILAINRLVYFDPNTSKTPLETIKKEITQGIQEHHKSLKEISIAHEQPEASIVEARRAFEASQVALDDALKYKIYHQGSDKIGVTRRLVNTLKIQINITSPEDLKIFHTVSADEIKELLKNARTRKQVAAQLSPIEHLIHFVTDTHPDKLRVLFTTLHDDIVPIIRFPEDLAALLIVLDMEKTEVVLDTLKGSLDKISKKTGVSRQAFERLAYGKPHPSQPADKLTKTLEHLSPEQQSLVLTRMKASLPNIIGSALEFLKLLEVLAQEQQDIVIKAFDNDLSKILKTPSDCRNILEKLLAEQRTAIFENKKQTIIAMTKTSKDFELISKYLLPIQRTEIFDARKGDLLKATKKSNDFSLILKYLSPTERTTVFKAKEKDLPQMIKKSKDFALILAYLSSTERTAVFEVKQKDLAKMIRSFEDFLNIIKPLSPKQQAFIAEEKKEYLPQMLALTRPDWVPDSPELYDVALKHIPPDKRTEIFEARKDDLANMIQSFEHFFQVGQHLKANERAFIFSARKNDLVQQIHSLEDFYALKTHLKPEERDFIFENKKNELVGMIQSLEDFYEIKEHLSSEQYKTVFDIKKNDLVPLIQSLDTFYQLSEHIKPDIHTDIFDTQKAVLIDKIAFIEDYYEIINYLSKAQRTDVFEGKKEDLAKTVQSLAEFYVLKTHLNPKERDFIFENKKNELVGMIQSLEDFYSLKEHLSTEQYTEIFYLKKEFLLGKVQTLSDFHKLKAHLEPKEQALILNEKKEDLAPLIHSINDFYQLKAYLTEENAFISDKQKAAWEKIIQDKSPTYQNWFHEQIKTIKKLVDSIKSTSGRWHSVWENKLLAAMDNQIPLSQVLKELSPKQRIGFLNTLENNIEELINKSLQELEQVLEHLPPEGQAFIINEIRSNKFAWLVDSPQAFKVFLMELKPEFAPQNLAFQDAKILSCLKDPTYFKTLLDSLDNENIKKLRDFFPEIIESPNDADKFLDTLSFEKRALIHTLLDTHPKKKYAQNETIEQLTKEQSNAFPKTPKIQGALKTDALHQVLNASWDRYISDELEAIHTQYPGNTKQSKAELASACETFLAESWDLINDTTLNYTRQPISKATKKMIEVALFVARKKEISPFSVLMPKEPLETFKAISPDLSIEKIQERLEIYMNQNPEKQFGVTKQLLETLNITQINITSSTDLNLIFTLEPYELTEILQDKRLKQEMMLQLSTPKALNAFIQTTRVDKLQIFLIHFKDKILSKIKSAHDFSILFANLDSDKTEIIFNQLQSIISKTFKSTHDFNQILEHLTPKQRSIVFKAHQSKLLKMTQSIDDFKHALQYLLPDERSIIFEAKNNLPDMIHTPEDFTKTMALLSVDERATLFESIQKKLTQMTSSYDDFITISTHLSGTQRNLLFENKKEIWFHMVQSLDDFCKLKKDFNPEEFNFIFEAKKDNLARMVSSAENFNHLLEHLSVGQRAVIFTEKKDDLPTLCQSKADFYQIIQHLAPWQRTAFFVQMKDSLPEMITSVYSFNHLMSQLETEEQADTLFELMQNALPQMIRSKKDFNQATEHLSIMQTTQLFRNTAINKVFSRLTFSGFKQKLYSSESADDAEKKQGKNNNPSAST